MINYLIDSENIGTKWISYLEEKFFNLYIYAKNLS